MIKSFKIVLGAAVSGVCLWFVFRGFDFRELQSALGKASYNWFVPAAVIFIFNMTLRSVRWQILLSPIKNIPLSRVVPVLFFGFFMNNILPARGGEILRGIALGRTANIATSSVLGSIVAERLTDMIGLLFILLLAARLLPWSKLPLVPLVSVLCLGLLLSGMFIVLSQKYRNSNGEKGVSGKFFRLLSEVTAGFLALRSVSKIATVAFLSCVIWCNELLQAFFVSRAMHVNLTFFESAALLMGLSVGVMIPAAPGYIGTYELFGKQMLLMLGKSGPLVLSFVLVLHFYQMVMMAFLGIGSIFFLPAKKASILRSSATVIP